MKFIVIVLAAFAISFNGYSQSDVQFTHFMYNKLSYNPAYTGSKGSFDLMGIYRKQWAGIDGSPTTGSFSAHAPFSDGRNAMGLSFMGDEIGKVNTTAVDLFYAYHIPVSANSKLSIGMQGRIEQAKINWTKADPLDLIDNLIPNTNESSYAPNFGLGAYYYANHYFVGLSVPRLLKNTLYLDRSEQVQKETIMTYYLTAGGIARLSSKLQVMPSFLVTYNSNAPVDLDMNANFLLMDKFILGASYRLADSVDGIIGFKFDTGLRISMAMDFTTSELEQFTNGSFEILLGYTFRCKDCNVNHLRYF